MILPGTRFAIIHQVGLHHAHPPVTHHLPVKQLDYRPPAAYPATARPVLSDPSDPAPTTPSPRRMTPAEASAAAIRQLIDSAAVGKASGSVTGLLFVAEMSGPMDAATAADLAELKVGIGHLQSLVLDLTTVAKRLEARVRAESSDQAGE